MAWYVLIPLWYLGAAVVAGVVLAWVAWYERWADDWEAPCHCCRPFTADDWEERHEN